MKHCETLIVFALATLPGIAAAQEGQDFSAERFQPAKTREGIITTEWAGIADHGQFDVALFLSYAHKPLTLRQQIGDKTHLAGSLVENRLGANLVAAISLFRWVELSFDLPLVLYQTRPDEIRAKGQTTALGELSAVGISDLSISPKLAILRAEDQGIDLALIANVTLPTGGEDHYFGDTGFTFVPELAISRQIDGLLLAANVSYVLREKVDFLDLSVDDELQYNVGIGYRLDAVDDIPLQVSAALAGGFAISEPFEQSNQTPMEALLATHYDFFQGFGAFIGAGFGIGDGYGSPQYRFFGGFRYARRVYDKDGDGILDNKDRCPDKPEDKDNFQDTDGCPELDNDNDKIPDEKDGAPNRPEDVDDFQDQDGVPDPDNDQDGVLDGDDRCPIEKGPVKNNGCPDTDADGDGIIDRLDQCTHQAEDKDDFEDQDGCPDTDNDKDLTLDDQDKCPNRAGPVENLGCPDSDTDGDGVVDRIDNCPTEAGSKGNQGCKKKQLVQIKREKLEILDKVFFATGRAKIRRRSFPLLNNIVSVLAAHPEIKKVVIEGHTDSVGSAKRNKRLSRFRARSVMKYLIRKGIDRKRLSSVGYGEEREVSTNKTRAGRAANRRVEFIIK